MIIYVCAECMPTNLDSFDGPADERECIVCGCAKVCREVNPADAIRTLLGPPPKVSSGEPPKGSTTPPAAPPIAPLTPPGLPPLPTPPPAQVGQ